VSQESRIQKSVVDWWAYACRGYRLDARLLSHSPNGGKRGKIEAAIFKGMGVRAGWPDLQLAVPRADKHGLFIELKSPDGALTAEQKELIPILQGQGYAVCVAWNVEEGIGAIVNYLKTGNPLLKG
jgi:hypothetical protein